LGEVIIQAIVNGRPTYFVRSADGSRYDLIDVLAQASDINNSGVVVGAVLDMDNTFLGAFGTLPLTIPEPRPAAVSLIVLTAFLLRIQRIRV
jgi:hypothetical protein